MNSGAVILRHLTGTYTVTRTAPRTLTNGRVGAPSTSTFTVDANVQPVTGRALETLPEGRSANDSRFVWTATAELKTAGTGQEPDKISIGGNSYEVLAVETWEDPRSVTYYRALVSLTSRSNPS
jgi:hypothetical protein